MASILWEQVNNLKRIIDSMIIARDAFVRHSPSAVRGDYLVGKLDRDIANLRTIIQEITIIKIDEETVRCILCERISDSVVLSYNKCPRYAAHFTGCIAQEFD